MTRTRFYTRLITMEARVSGLEAYNSKTQLLLEAIQCLLEEKFARLETRFDSIDSCREGFDPPLTFDVNNGD